jgi:hypothetical protein
MPGDFDCYRDEEGDCERSGIDDEIIDDSQDSDVLELNRVVDFFKKPHRTSGRSAAAAAVSGNRTSKENCKGESINQHFWKQTVTSLSNISFNLTFASCFQTLYCRWLVPILTSDERERERVLRRRMRTSLGNCVCANIKEHYRSDETCSPAGNAAGCSHHTCSKTSPRQTCEVLA